MRQDLNERLRDAAHQGDLQNVKECLSSGAEINSRNSRGWSAITQAASWGRLKVLLTLIRNGADIELPTNTGQTALTEAARWGHVELVRKLLDFGAKIEHKTITGYTALSWSARWGKLDVLSLLLQRGANIDHRSARGHSALTEAARWGHIEIVKKLLMKGADFRTKTSTGVTPLQWATNMGRAEVVNVLKNFEDYANKNLEVVVEVDSRKEEFKWSHDLTKEQLLSKAIVEQKLDIAVILLARGVKGENIDVHTKEKLFHMAILMGVSHVVRKLLCLGVSMNVVLDEDGNTALHIAAKIGLLYTVRLLLSVGADKCLKNEKGETPIDVTDNEDVKNEFQAYSETGEDKQDQLFRRAAIEGKYYSLNILLELGINVDKPNENGNTALHLAVEKGNEDIIKILVSNGATVYIQNKLGQTPLDGAISSKNEKVIKILLVEFLSFSLKNRSAFKKREYQNFIGYGENMFHLRKHFHDVSLLRYITDQGDIKLKEREELLFLLVLIDKSRYPKDLENSELRVIEQVRMGLPSSKGLRECIKSVQKHYKWGSPKLYFMRFFSIFKNIIFGWIMYFLDLGTDLKFSTDMLNNAKRNFTNELDVCKYNMDPMIDNIVIFCKEDFSSKSCYNSLKSLGRTGKDCFETEQRFDNSDEWNLAGLVTLLHCFIPLVFAIFIFILGCIKTKIVDPSKIPLPFISKVYKTYIEWKLFFVFTVIGDDRRYLEEKEKWQPELEEYEKVITLSMATEASLEACFQFWFQTIFLLPSVILGIIDIDGADQITDLVNFRIFSIFLSFFTFAWASFTIR